MTTTTAASTPAVQSAIPLLLSDHELAPLIGLSKHFLRKDRISAHPAVPFIRIGPKVVKYRLEDVMAVLSSHQGGTKRKAGAK